MEEICFHCTEPVVPTSNKTIYINPNGSTSDESEAFYMCMKCVVKFFQHISFEVSKVEKAFEFINREPSPLPETPKE